MRRTREEFNALTGRRDFVPRPLDPAVEAKLARIMAVQKKRDTLDRIRLSAWRIQKELEHKLELARRSGGADEGPLLTEIKQLRADLATLEV